MTEASFGDKTGVTYSYDPFGRKVRRAETAWVALGNPNGTPPGLTDEKGWGNNSDRPDHGQATNANGNDKSQGNGKKDVCPDDVQNDPHANHDEKAPAHKKLKLREEMTSYFYDGLSLNLLKEYKGLSASKAEYYYANGQVVGRKMFGIKNSILPDREQGLANGGTYYYLTDALGSVTDLVDTKGTVARQYRYDAFGGLFTGTMGLYNTTGLTGKSYDAKVGMMDYSARWYDPTVGRFTQADSYLGRLDVPLSEHRYSYALNNPVNLSDPTGHYVADNDTSATDDPYITYNGTWVRTDFGGGEVPTQPNGDAWTRIWVTETKWTRHWWKYTKDDNTFVSEGDEPWDGEYRVEIDFVLHNGVWDQTEDIPRITGSLRPEGAEDPDTGPTKEQLEQQAREQAERIINETVGTAPVTVPDATAGKSYNPGASSTTQGKFAGQVLSPMTSEEQRVASMSATDQYVYGVCLQEAALHGAPQAPGCFASFPWKFGQISSDQLLTMGMVDAIAVAGASTTPRWDAPVLATSPAPVNSDISPDSFIRPSISADNAPRASAVTFSSVPTGNELRAWATGQGYELLSHENGIEVWGIQGDGGWRLKLKDPSTTPGIDPGSMIYRYSARVSPGVYLDPVTGQTGTRTELGHLPFQP